MKLNAYLADKKMSVADFAKLVPVDPVTVHRWISGGRFPMKHLAKIAEITQGAVTANDFVTVPPADAGTAQVAAE